MQLPMRRVALARLIWALIGSMALIWSVGGYLLVDRYQKSHSFEALQLALVQSANQEKALQQRVMAQAKRLHALEQRRFKVVTQQSQSALQWFALGAVLPPTGYWVRAAWQPESLATVAMVDRAAQWGEVEERWRQLMPKAEAAFAEHSRRMELQPSGNWRIVWQVVWSPSNAD